MPGRALPVPFRRSGTDIPPPGRFNQPPEAVDEELEALSQALVEVADADDWSVLAERAKPLLAKIAAGKRLADVHRRRRAPVLYRRP